MSVLLVSAEMREVLGLAHRILVMREGRIAGEVGRGDFSEERVMALATGAKEG
jgi:ABC-type sugar transport system ATPase subunit